MIKYLTLLFVCLFTWQISVAATGDTTIVTAHWGTNLNSPPSNDDNWVVFPNTNTTYQKILMRFTLGCGTPACSHWDYTVNAELGKKNGALDSAIVAIDTLTSDTTWSYSDHVNFTELGRLITPYGNYMDFNWPQNQAHGFDSSWTHPYIYDVTDYAAMLKDSVVIRVHYDGWTDAFRANVEFIFIEGQPTRTVENVKEIYHSYYGYGNSADFENQVTARAFTIGPNVTSAKVSVIITGHGNQGEFDPHSFFVRVNGGIVYSQLFWKDDCDVNPIAPQGGTWIFPRANWCPGDKVPVYEADVTPHITPGQSVSLDIDLDDFVIQNGASAGYGISAYLITYTSQKDNDVMMDEIIAPNSAKPYLHWNPICTQPKVKIKNTGKQNLTYAQIKYWVKGGTYWYYEWTGNLPPFQSEQVTLPAFDWFGLDTADRRFYAEVSWPNQKPDEYAFNNKLESAFNMTPKLDSVFYIQFQSNNRPEENNYVVRNENGDTIKFRSTFNASATLRDTLRLQPGSYAFDFNDFDVSNFGCGDGLKFFVNQPPNASSGDPWYETSGQLRLMKVPSGTIKNFDPDFGRNIHYEFTVGYPLGYNPPKQAPTEPEHPTAINEIEGSYLNMVVFPNPANGMLNVEVNSNQGTEGAIVITDLSGRVVRAIQTDNSTRHVVSIATSELSGGLYLVSYRTQNTTITKRVVIQ